MAGKKGIEAAARLRLRSKEQRGGNAKQPDPWTRDEADSLAFGRTAGCSTSP